MKPVLMAGLVVLVIATPLLIWFLVRRNHREVNDNARWEAYSLPGGARYTGWEVGCELVLTSGAIRRVTQSWEVEPGEQEKLSALADANDECVRRNRVRATGGNDLW